MIMFRNILAAVSAVLLLGLASSYMPIAAAGDLPTEKGCKKLKEADSVMKGWCAAIAYPVIKPWWITGRRHYRQEATSDHRSLL